jgi:hypothetical protein
MLISNPLQKLQKDSREKVISEKVTKNGVFDFYYRVHKFSAYLLVGEIFCIFSNGFELSIQLFFDTHIEVLPKIFLRLY